mmetsp:Transcript_42749/g.79158  ORF Transcript_42749/g.79158 Transcript_42749/m.79158 type:complete len:236 (-) Transcript_42749:68-775(-)
MQHPFARVHPCLELRERPYAPVQQPRHRDGARQRQSRQRREVAARRPRHHHARRKDGRQSRHQRADHLQPYRQPPIGRLVAVIRPRVAVELLHEFRHESFGRSVRPYRRQSAQRFGEVRVHGRTGDGIESLRLSGDLPEVVQYDDVHDQYGNDRDAEPRSDERDGPKRYNHGEGAKKEEVEVLAEFLIDAVHVLREAREYSAGRSRIEEGHGRPQHARQNVLVQLLRRPYSELRQ